MGAPIFRHDIEQGTPAWHAAKVGVLGSTDAAKIITPKTKRIAAGAKMVVRDKVTELARGWTRTIPTTYAMERGLELEPRAREWYCTHFWQMDTIGIVYRDESRRVGCSPDGVHMDSERGLEIKCPMDEAHISYLLDGGLPSEYEPQVQWMMWVTGWRRWAFLSWHPDYPPLVLDIHRDPEWMAAFDAAVPEVLKQIDDAKALLEERGMTWPTPGELPEDAPF